MTGEKGCYNCKWAKGQYCDRPGSSDCNWVGEMFRGEQNDWIHWESSGATDLMFLENHGIANLATKLKLSDELRRVADLLDQ